MRIKEAEDIINKNISILRDTPCSMMHHLNKKGGLMIHLQNTFKLAQEYFPDDESLHALALIHDLGKAQYYGLVGNDQFGYQIKIISRQEHEVLTIKMLKESGYDVTEEERDAILLHHGGFSNFNGVVKFNELAVKLHFCDHLSTIRESK